MKLRLPRIFMPPTTIGLLLLPVWIFFSAPQVGAQTSAPASAATSAPLKNAAEPPIDALIRDNFGPNLPIVGGAKPMVLKGDFNGDGIGDIAVLVQAKGKRGELLPGVEIIQTSEGARPLEPTTVMNGQHSLALILGNATGWQTPKTTGKYLIYAFGWIGWAGPQTGDLIVLPKTAKRDKQGYATISPENYVSMPRDNKGDVIVVPTEAGINTILYWNGKTYRFWLDPGDTP